MIASQNSLNGSQYANETIEIISDCSNNRYLIKIKADKGF